MRRLSRRDGVGISESYLIAGLAEIFVEFRLANVTRDRWIALTLTG
jgi:hypothetical protein